MYPTQDLRLSRSETAGSVQLNRDQSARWAPPLFDSPPSCFGERGLNVGQRTMVRDVSSSRDRYQVGTSFQPGKGPTPSFQPVPEDGSLTTRRLVNERSSSRSSLRGRQCRGGFKRSGTDQSRSVLSSPDVETQRRSPKIAMRFTAPLWPRRRCGSPPDNRPIRTIPSTLPVAATVPDGSTGAARMLAPCCGAQATRAPPDRDVGRTDLPVPVTNSGDLWVSSLGDPSDGPYWPAPS